MTIGSIWEEIYLMEPISNRSVWMLPLPQKLNRRSKNHRVTGVRYMLRCWSMKCLPLFFSTIQIMYLCNVCRFQGELAINLKIVTKLHYILEALWSVVFTYKTIGRKEFNHISMFINLVLKWLFNAWSNALKNKSFNKLNT